MAKQQPIAPNRNILSIKIIVLLVLLLQLGFRVDITINIHNTRSVCGNRLIP